MNIDVTINEDQLRKLILAYLSEQLGEVQFDPKYVKIEVKSKQNYKSEWEAAAFRATLSVSTL